jgi:hypothetical protein
VRVTRVREVRNACETLAGKPECSRLSHVEDVDGRIIFIVRQSCPATAMQATSGKRRCWSYSFLTSALDGVSGQRHVPAALYPRKNDPSCSLDRRLSGPHRDLRKKSFASAGDRTPVARSSSLWSDTILTANPINTKCNITDCQSKWFI